MLSKYDVWMKEHEEALQAIIDKGDHGRSDWNEPEDLVPDLLSIGLDELTEEFPEAFIARGSDNNDEDDEDDEEQEEKDEDKDEDEDEEKDEEYYGNEIE